MSTSGGAGGGGGSLTTDSGVITANQFLPTAAAAWLTTASWAVGTWYVTVSALLHELTTGDTGSIWLADGTATATYDGPCQASAVFPAVGDYLSVSFGGLVIVTVAGTVDLMGVAGNATNVVLEGSVAGPPYYPCGYVAVKVA